MKRSTLHLTMLLSFILLLTGCTAGQPHNSAAETEDRTIPFSENQVYAVAYLGYQQTGDLDYYAEQYLGSSLLPMHYLSAGDYYLVIPRYTGMAVSLYRIDFETSQPILIYEDPDCRPFVIQCNASDIFADAVIQLTYEDHTIEFSPFISLKDGSVEVGENGLDLTREQTP